MGTWGRLVCTKFAWGLSQALHSILLEKIVLAGCNRTPYFKACTTLAVNGCSPVHLSCIIAL